MRAQQPRGKQWLRFTWINISRRKSLSADSRQFYQEMQIGTAKPTPAGWRAFPIISSIPCLFLTNTAWAILSRTANILEQIYQNHQVAILTGGSGLFIRAGCEGLDRFPEVPAKVRKKVEALYLEKGLEFVQDYLQRVDPVYFQEVDQNNPHRLIRALAMCRSFRNAFFSFSGKEQKQSALLFQCTFSWNGTGKPFINASISG
ncbi:MAG: hypothetical protein IPL49_11005 [Saprospirales bacterium]|nr:hypothetical protein [Saprospirales bacterium]